MLDTVTSNVLKNRIKCDRISMDIAQESKAQMMVRYDAPRPTCVSATCALATCDG